MRPAEIKQIRFTTRRGLQDSAGEIHDLTQCRWLRDDIQSQT